MKNTSLLRIVMTMMVVTLTSCSASGEGSIRLKDIIEIRGYPPPPDMASFGAPPPARRDIKGAEVKEFLKGYVPVSNDKAVGSPLGAGDATAVFKDGERPITFMYVTCPGQQPGTDMFKGKPHRIVFVVNAEFVMFELEGLCEGFEEKPAPSADRIVPYEAIKDGNVDEVKQSLRAGADPNARYEDGKTPLTLAASRGNLPIVQALVERKAEVSGLDGEGRFPLHAAASVHDGGAMVRYLIEHGADVNQGTKGYFGGDGKTALMQSAGSKTIETARLLIDAGANVKAESGGFTALHGAALAGDVEMTRLLIAKGANVNAAQTEGFTGRTPLMCAVHSGTVETATLLMEAGADVNTVQSVDGETALLQAVKRGRPEFVELLLAKRAAVDSRNKDGETALYAAADEGDTRSMALLLDRGANPNLQNESGYTPLMIAVIRDSREAARMLLEKGADTRMKSSRGQSALDLAQEMGKAEIATLLRARG